MKQWNDHTDTLLTEFGEYQVEWNAMTGGYKAVLYDSGDTPIWHSVRVQSDPNGHDGTRFSDYDAIMKCRQYAMEHYDRARTGKIIFTPHNPRSRGIMT
jgi:hypothetical protein